MVSFVERQADRPVLARRTMKLSERIQMEQEMVREGKLESLGTLAGGIAQDFTTLSSPRW
jgi:hypothetical protein